MKNEKSVSIATNFSINNIVVDINEASKELKEINNLIEIIKTRVLSLNAHYHVSDERSNKLIASNIRSLSLLYKIKKDIGGLDNPNNLDYSHILKNLKKQDS